MQEQHFDRMVDRISDAFEEKSPTSREIIRREFEAVRARGELLTLNESEVALIEDYRLWKRTSNGTGPVFHWKKRKTAPATGLSTPAPQEATPAEEPTIEEMSGLVEDFTGGRPLKEHLDDLRGKQEPAAIMDAPAEESKSGSL